MALHKISKIKVVDSLTSAVVTTSILSGTDFNAYWMSEGSGGCDCNRFDWYINGKGQESDIDYPCSNDIPRFRLIVFNDADEVLLDDTKDAKNPFQVADGIPY